MIGFVGRAVSSAGRGVRWWCWLQWLLVVLSTVLEIYLCPNAREVVEYEECCSCRPEGVSSRESVGMLS